MRLSLLLVLLLLNLGCENRSGVSSTKPSRAVNEITATNVHSAFADPDISIEEGVDFHEIRTFVGQPALDTTIAVFEQPPPAPRHLEIAKGFADDPKTEEFEGGVIENPNNRSPDIDRWLKALLAEPFHADGTGAPYCAAFVSFCLSEAGNVTAPRTRSAKARHFIQASSFRADFCAKSLELAFEECSAEVDARVVLRGANIRPGTLVIWKRKRDPDNSLGHIGMVTSWEGHKGKTVEGNTSSGNAGSQADGGGVYLREREVKIGSWFRITDFTTVSLDSD